MKRGGGRQLKGERCKQHHPGENQFRGWLFSVRHNVEPIVACPEKRSHLKCASCEPFHKAAGSSQVHKVNPSCSLWNWGLAKSVCVVSKPRMKPIRSMAVLRSPLIARSLATDNCSKQGINLHWQDSQSACLHHIGMTWRHYLPNKTWGTSCNQRLVLRQGAAVAQDWHILHQGLAQ